MSEKRWWQKENDKIAVDRIVTPTDSLCLPSPTIRRVVRLVMRMRCRGLSLRCDKAYKHEECAARRYHQGVSSLPRLQTFWRTIGKVADAPPRLTRAVP